MKYAEAGGGTPPDSGWHAQRGDGAGALALGRGETKGVKWTHLRRGRPELVRRHRLAARVDERAELRREAVAPKGAREPRQLQQQRVEGA